MAGTLTVQGVATINIDTISQGVNLTDSGTVDLPVTVSGMLTGATFAAKAEKHRLLTELTWYSRHAGGVYIAASNLTIVDGLYQMSYAGDFPRTGSPRVRLSLTRLGGSPLGGNIVQRLRAQSTLQTNSYSITSTPRIALPVGGTEIDTVSNAFRASKDGTMTVFASGLLYSFSGADASKGECKVYDTRGNAAEADWQRVYSPDHVFTNPGHLVIENGLLRIMGIVGGNNGSHRYFVWTGSTYTEVSGSTSGDGTNLGGTGVTATYTRLHITTLSPWRVTVELRSVHSASPYFLTKTITLDRGKPLASVTLAASVTTLLFGLTAGRWVFTKGAPLSGGDMQRPAFDDTEETGNAALNAPEDNWLACFTTLSSSTGTLGLVAWASNAYAYSAREGGGGFVTATSATSLTLWIGGVKYDTSSAQLEAEAGTLTGGATAVSTVAGASGSGSDQVLLNAINAQVDMTTNLASIGGSTVEVVFRLASETTGVGSTVDLIIRNTTAGSNLASVTRDNNHFAAANTWYWQSVVGTGWNGTDTLVARVTMTAYGGNDIYIDQCIAVIIAGSSTQMQIDDVAGQALTESIVVPITARHVF